MHSLQDAASQPLSVRAQLAVAAAWSPNPEKPPPYLDLPVGDGAGQAAVLAKWAANAPLAFIDQHIGNIRRYRAIGLDIGDQNPGLADAKQIKAVLDSYGIRVQFEIYQGTHTSAVADRFQNHVLPFFAENLCRDAPACGRTRSEESRMKLYRTGKGTNRMRRIEQQSCGQGTDYAA